MSSKLITYDLCAPGNNYNSLYEKIKSYPYWAKITESTWVVKTNDSCPTVRDALTSVLDSNDRIFVGELTGIAAWKNIIADSESVKQHL